MASRDLVYSRFEWNVCRETAPWQPNPFIDDAVRVTFDIFEAQHTFSDLPGATSPEFSVQRVHSTTSDFSLNELTRLNSLPATAYTVEELKYLYFRFNFPTNLWRNFLLELLLKARMYARSHDRFALGVSIIWEKFLRVSSNPTTLDVALEASFQEAAMAVARVPAAEEAISRRVERFSVEREGVAETCSICLDNIASGAEAGRMPCKHIFHEHCILQWLGVSSSCPLCRTLLE